MVRDMTEMGRSMDAVHEIIADLIRTETEFAERLCTIALQQGYALTELSWHLPSALDTVRQRELWGTLNGQSRLIGISRIRFDDPTRVSIECVPVLISLPDPL